MGRNTKQSENEIIEKAAKILERRATYKNAQTFLESPDLVKDIFVNRLSAKEQEVFSVAFLDNRHRLIVVEDLFFGTINAAAVYPREVIKAALNHNAAAIILSHNHPSGNASPSKSDLAITETLKEACKYIDVRVLDHIIVGLGEVASLAERGQM